MRKLNLTFIGVLLLSITFAAPASEPVAASILRVDQSYALGFEHVMNIDSRGQSPGQFKYVEDFALTIDGHLAVTDASHAYVEIFNKTNGEFITRFAGWGEELTPNIN